MSCVNTKTKEFKEASIRNNINEATLEAIVHAFQNTEGNENLFPSDEYINSQLQGLAMTNASAAQIRLWKSRYRKPIIVNNLKDAERIVKEISKYFNSSSIVMYQTRDGNYKITVARPTQNRGKLMYQKSNDKLANLKRVREYYRTSLDTEERRKNYSETLKSIRAIYTRKVYYPKDKETLSNVDVRLNNIIKEILKKSGWAIKSAYIVNIQGKGRRIQLEFKNFDEILNDKLSLLDNLDDDTLASEALRLEQESSLNEEYYINKKKVESLKEQVFKKNLFIKPNELEVAFDFLESLENNKDLNQYVDTCIRWLKNNSISLPRDNHKVLDAFMLARQQGIDTQQFNSPIELILWSIRNKKVDIEEGKVVNPRELNKLSFNRTIQVEEGLIEIFDVESTPEGQEVICQILADASPKVDGKPAVESHWCLSTYNYNKDTGKATPTSSARDYWNHYDGGRRQIAFLNGKPLAFNSSVREEDEWWDFYDGSKNNYKGYSTIEECDRKATEEFYTKGVENKQHGDDFLYYSLGPYNYMLRGDKIDSIDYSQTSYFMGKRQSVEWSYNPYRSSNNYNLSIIGVKGSLFIDGEGVLIESAYHWTGVPIKNHKTELITIGYIPSYKGRSQQKQTPLIEYSKEKEAFVLTVDGNIVQILGSFPKEKMETFMFTIDNLSLETVPSKKIQDSLVDYTNTIGNIIRNGITKYAKSLKESESKKEQETNNTVATPNIQEASEDAVTINSTVNALNSLGLDSTVPTEYTSDTQDEYHDFEVINEEDLEYIGNSVNEYNINEEPIEPTTIIDTLESLREGKLEQIYNEGVKKPFNRELSKSLHDILKAYHFEIIEGDLREVFGEDTLGALDILQKIVYLAHEGDRNALTDAEEFAHAFIELMGSAYHRNTKAYPATKEYTELRDLIEKTTLYQSTLKQYRDVYTYANGDPDLPLIKKEALGKALAAVLNDRYEAKTEADHNFIAKLKNWFKDVLLYFKSIFKDEAKLQHKLNKIADSILNGTYAEKYLNKVKDTDYKLVEFKETLIQQSAKDGGKALGIIQAINRLKGKVTGSLAYRAQGTVYRRDMDSLHDLDFVFDANSHDIFTSHPSLRTLRRISPNRWWTVDRVKEAVEQSSFATELKRQVPDLTIMYAYPGPNGIIVNAVVSEDQDLVAKFMSMTGNFNTRLEQLTQEERDKLYLLDFFLNKEDSYESFTDEESGIEMVDYTVPFESKLKFGRAKDIYDYQRFKPSHRRYKISPSTMYQKKAEGATSSVSTTKFSTTEVSSYPQRTRDNADWSDVTLALATDFNTRGEQLTQRVAGNKYIASPLPGDSNNDYLPYNNEAAYSYYAKEIYKKLEEKGKTSNIKLNIAGNGIYSLTDFATQEELNIYVTNILRKLQDLGVTISEIRSGGQTGVDEAGIIAAQRLGIPNSVHTTSNYAFRVTEKEFNEKYKSILSENEYKKVGNDYDILNRQDLFEARFKNESTSKENVSETVSEQKIEDPFLQESLEITRQIDTLLDSSIITASEVRHIAEQAVYWISDHITEIQRNPELAVTIYGDRVKGNNFANMSRQEIVQTIGPSSIMAMCKEKFRPRPGKYQKSSTTKKARLIVDNWEAIMKFATDAFSTMEDFSITKISGRDEILENDSIDVDNYNESNDKDEVAEIQGDTQEHWQIENRTIDVLYSMSQLVKHALRECYQLDSEGNKIKSEFGINERVDVIDATSSILRWTQGALTLKDMIDKLESKKQNNPWISQIIDRLKDDSGNESDFQSQFFSVFCKHFQSYSIVTKRKGKYVTMPVNEFPALRDAFNSITTLFKVNEHPMFTSEGVNKKTFKEFKSTYEDLVPLRRTFINEDKKEIARKLSYIANTLGYYYATPEVMESILDERTFRNMLTTVGYMVKAIEDNLDNKNYTPFEFKSKGSISGNIRMFLRPITDKLEDTAVSSFYDSGKMYQSYVTPSYMTKLMNKFNLTGEEFDTFIMDEYGKYSWFKEESDDIEEGWRNSWLEILVKDENAKSVFKHKVQLNFNKHNYMRNMNDSEYELSMISEYFSENYKEGETRVPAWFRVPVLSNKPSSEYIRFYSYRGADYKDIITSNLKKVFDQELSRIQTVSLRNYSKEDSEFIKNFDKNGKRFNFLSFMNDYLDGILTNTELGKLLKKKLEGKQLTSEEETSLNSLAEAAIRENMERKALAIVSDWKSKGIVEGAKQIENVGSEESEITENLINFVWNDTLAAINIMQLTITDAAYYKDAEDIQKRFAQIHAPGVRGNVNATDYNGNVVTDGKERTLYLKDFDDFVSNIIENVSIVFDRKIEAAPESEKAQWIALKESLVGEKGAFREINVADAQGYNSPTSYRKKAFIFGKWSRQAEEIYQKLKNNDYTYSDLRVAFQPLKPFVYSQISKSTNVDAPLNELKVPVQNKNSEYLLILADAILQGEDTGRPNLLRAVYEVMEESADKNPTKGIDTIQFESTVKSGLMGAIDIKQFSDMEGGEVAAKKLLEDSVYNEDGSYNSTFVHEIPFEDYCLQQEIPDHFKQHEQAHGSQIRYIIPSDLEEVDYLGNPVTYEVEGRQLTAEEFKIEYENTIAENINESIENLTKELHLDDSDIKARNIALSKILQREILSSPRYGVDLFQACSLDENGNFRIPLGDPIQSKRVEQLINSIIKNRVNKQTIAGGPVVQVSNFGLSKELNIRFKGKDGKILMTKAEYTEKMAENWKLQGHEGILPMSKIDAQYQEYLKANQAGIAYFEVFAPIYTKEIFEKFQNPDGSIDMEAIEALHPDLLKMVGYRIPTEDKYSAAPLKIVGFLPREAGDGIMLPSDITLLSGSDFDIDKMYLMLKNIPIRMRNREDVYNDMFDALVASRAKTTTVTSKIKQSIREELNMFMNNPQIMKNADALHQYMWKLYKRFAYEAVPPTHGREYRNNKIVDMTYAVLTHETTADKILNPGGFEPQKRMGYMVEAYRNLASEGITWEQLEKMSVGELSELAHTNKNLAFIDAQTHFYKQNSSGSTLIGIFAVHKVAHAVLEGDGFLLNIEEVCSLEENEFFTIAGTSFGGNMVIDPKYDVNGQLIGKSLGSNVAASADTGKFPVLDLNNINPTTANVLCALERLGMPYDDIALFLSQSTISNILNAYNTENMNGFSRLGDIINRRLSELEDELFIETYSDLNKEALSKEELIEGILSNPKPEIEYKVLRTFQRIQKIGDAMRGITYATRFNSISSAVGPLIIDNLITENKIKNFSDSILKPNEEPADITDVFTKHPILNQFFRTLSIARNMFGNMPANSRGFRNILDSMDSKLSNIIYSDRKLLSTFSDFYQSYLLIASETVNEKQLINYINGFPTWFFKQNFKEKYKDNALIQAIKLDTDSTTGRPVLKVDITGLKTKQKEVLMNAWIDLHKENPELSKQLFMYNFFRRGIGFSPETFMGLVPTYVKERIEGYTDTYRKLPSVSGALVIDQFIRNNWDNNKLVPRKKVKLVWHDKIAEVTNPKEIKEMKNVPYFKIKIGNTDRLFRQSEVTETSVFYEEITPLGNNGEYLEISNSYISNPITIPNIAKEDVSNSEISESSNQDIDNDNPSSNIETRTEEQETLDLLYQLIENGKTVTNKEQAVSKVEEYKSKSDKEKKSLESGMKKYFRNRLMKLNIPFDERKIDEVYNKMCK